MVLGVMSGRLSPDFSQLWSWLLSGYQLAHVVLVHCGFRRTEKGEGRREEGRRGERRGIKATWVPGFRLWVFCKSSTGFVHLIIIST
jgi:hypothetical protein